MSIPNLSQNSLVKNLIKMTKNTVSGSMPKLDQNPLHMISELLGGKAGAISSLLPTNPGMLGFLCPELAVAGCIMNGAKGFAESLGEGLKTMPSVGSNDNSIPENTSSTGRTLDQRIDSIMNSDIPVAEKITLLASVMADSLDKQAEEVMNDWSSDMKRVAHQGNSGDPNSTEGSNESNSQYLQVRLQQLMEKKNQLISLASNMNKAEHTTKSSVIQNIRV